MATYVNLLKDIFRTKKLRNRFILYFLSASLIPTLIIGIATYKISEKLVIDIEIKETSSRMSELKARVNNLLNEKETIAIKFYINQYVQNALTASRDIQENEFEIMKLLFANEYMNGNHSIFLSGGENLLYTNVRYTLSDSIEMINRFNRELNSYNASYRWMGIDKINDEYVMPYVRIIRKLDNSKELGLVVINLKESTVYNLYKSTIKEFNRDIYILDGENRIISNENKELLGQKLDDVYNLNGKTMIDKKYFKSSVNGTNHLFIVMEDEKTDWKYVSKVPLEMIFIGAKSIYTITVLISILCVLISFAFAVVVSSRVTIPINNLISLMNVVEKEGNLDLEFKTDSYDEINKLGSFFNQMLKRLKSSIDKIYEVQKAKRDAELRALVSQINPHFLYNTLSSIIWLANDNKTEQVIQVTNALSKLFRIGISKGKEIIKMSEEIEHVKSYVTIQNIRYKNKFIFIIDIDDSILNYYTLKLVLQPLVENSIYHGVKNMNSRGIIKVEGKKEQNSIIINVIDNGDGLTDEQVLNLNDFLEGKTEIEDFGIGIKNVNDRLKLYFGQDYGLSYSKKENKVIATVKMPLMDTVNMN
jgi:two-component system sensor histidine kinase YesM